MKPGREMALRTEPHLAVLPKLCRRWQQKEGNDPLAHVACGNELREALRRSEPLLGDEAQDDSTRPGRGAQRLTPFFAARDSLVIDKNIAKAVAAQPSFQGIRRGIVPAGVTYKYDCHGRVRALCC
jgi:hypothetical protein